MAAGGTGQSKSQNRRPVSRILVSMRVCKPPERDEKASLVEQAENERHRGGEEESSKQSSAGVGAASWALL